MLWFKFVLSPLNFRHGYLCSHNTLASDFIDARLYAYLPLHLVYSTIHRHRFCNARVGFDLKEMHLIVEKIMHFSLLNPLSLHQISQLRLFKLSSSTHFVDLQIEHFVGRFGFTFHNLKLLSVVCDLRNNIIHFTRKLLNISS